MPTTPPRRVVFRDPPPAFEWDPTPPDTPSPGETARMNERKARRKERFLRDELDWTLPPASPEAPRTPPVSPKGWSPPTSPKLIIDE